MLVPARFGLLGAVFMALSSCTRGPMTPICEHPARAGCTPCATVVVPEVDGLLHFDAEEPYVCWSAVNFDGVRCLHLPSRTLTQVPPPPSELGLLDWFDLWQGKLFMDLPAYFDLRAGTYVPFADHAGDWSVAGPAGVAWVMRSSRTYRDYRPHTIRDYTRHYGPMVDVWGGPIELLPWHSGPRVIAVPDDLGFTHRKDLGRLIALEAGHVVFTTIDGIRSVSLDDGKDMKLAAENRWQAVAAAGGRVYYTLDDELFSQRIGGGDEQSHARIEGTTLALSAGKNWVALLVAGPQPGGRIVVVGRDDTRHELLALRPDALSTTYVWRPLVIDGDRLYVVMSVDHVPAIIRIPLLPTLPARRCSTLR